MPEPVSEQQRIGRKVRAMYNAHPFPQREVILPQRSDERFRYIYTQFLHIPLDELNGRVMLDAGCGTGENTWSWRRLLDPSARVMAMDISYSSIRIARTAQSAIGAVPSFAVESLAELALADNSVDFVFCSGVLHHIPHRARAYQELMRVLKPGGYVVLVLYHRYGRALHGLRRAVIDLIEREDIDRRVQWADRLFNHSMRKLARRERVPYEGVLYDQFVLCESRHSIGEVVDWFKRSNIEYLGTWPPVEWNQVGKGLRFSHQLTEHRQSFAYRALLKMFPTTHETPQRAPNVWTRGSMQFLWMCSQLQLFAISGRKVADGI